MLETIRQYQITQLSVEGFKGYQEPVTFQFGPLNEITGHMGVGKSSIADAIAFAITGTGFYGAGRLDRFYHTGTRALSVALELTDAEGTPHRLLRRRVQDSMEICWDERKVTQRDLTALFGEKDLFLSMFNPLYFIEVLGNQGRDLLERYLPTIPREQIVAGLSEHTQALLAQAAFSSPEVLAKELRADLANLEKDFAYAQGQLDRVSAQAEEQDAALREKEAALEEATGQAEMLECRRTTGFDGASLRDQLADLYARHEELLREPPQPPDTTALDHALEESAASLERRRAEVYQSRYSQPLAEQQAALTALRREVQRQKHICAGLKAGVQCPVCRQTVTAEGLPALRREFEASIRSLCQQGREQVQAYQQLQERDARDRAAFVQEQRQALTTGAEQLEQLRQQREQIQQTARQASKQHTQQATQLRAQIQNIELDLEYGRLTQEEYETLTRAKGAVDTLTAELAVLREQAAQLPQTIQAQQTALAEIQGRMAEKRELLSALGRYIARRAELALSALRMNRVSLSLYDVAKTTGEVRDTFRFCYEGRPYFCLSRSEKIRAGLEVSELIKGIVGIRCPVFIDDAESVPVIDNVRPSGQIFLATVVRGAQLQVRVGSLAAPSQAA